MRHELYEKVKQVLDEARQILARFAEVETTLTATDSEKVRAETAEMTALMRSFALSFSYQPASRTSCVTSSGFSR